MKLEDRVAQLEIRDYGHDDNAEHVISGIKDIIVTACPKDNNHSKQIEEAILNFLENFRYDGELSDIEIEEGHYTRENKKQQEINSLNKIIEEIQESTKELEKIKTSWM